MTQIIPLRKSHINSIIELNIEFESYLNSLSRSNRDTFDGEKKRAQILEYAFWNKKLFSGYVARIWKKIVGYAFYHSGFDPDEMQGKVIYLIDLYVRGQARGKWVGKALIEKLQDDKDSLGLYFAVWKKNPTAIEFYKRLGADWEEEVPFMKLMK